MLKVKELKLKIMQQKCNIAEKELKVETLLENIERIKEDTQISAKALSKLESELEELTKEG